jgi:hypothetical protein
MKPLLATGTARKRRFPSLPAGYLDRVDTMTVVEVDGGPRLELPEEPLDVKVGLRDTLLEGSDWRDGFADDVCIALWIWKLWQPALEPYGMTREDFVDQVTAYRRELWLWLIGDRQWLQFVTGLAGRVVRRLPEPAQA